MARVATNRVKRAADRAESKLSSVAPLLLRMLRRSIFGVNREERKERLGLAELHVLLLKVERGSVKTALADVADTQNKVQDLVAQKAADDAATAAATIEAARATAVTAMLAMGLSAARNTTLTAIILTLSDASKAAATKAAEDAARGGGNRVLTKVENRQTDKLIILDDNVDKFKDAIATEGERLGINI